MKFKKNIAAVILSVALVCFIGCKKDDADGDGIIGGHSYVDLGLPSGVLWASCNVGATSSEGCGDYFSWGETQLKTVYNWSTYKYCKGDHDQLIKYCNNSSFGYNDYTDNLTTLQPRDDAAKTNWGSGWRIPTIIEWMELYQNTTSTWKTINGVKGRRFVAPNGNSVFLPVTGFFWESRVYYSEFGYYWSSSLFSDPHVARNCVISIDNDYYISVSGRDNGLSIRPVHSAVKN